MPMSRWSGLFLVALVLAACGESGGPPTTAGSVSTRPTTEVSVAVTHWINTNAHPLEGSHLSLPHHDLEPLREIVGDAHIVALGEGTHGTRDFFEMKARILRFLVEEMDFNTFAIEATWPESRRLDHYVRTGEGDPRKLLSGLYFWTWNTESVLEMIEWMRDHNEAGGDVGFHGFDIQYPGLALHNLIEYIRTVDPEGVEEMAEKVHCLAIFANDHRGEFPMGGSEGSIYAGACEVSLREARELLLAKRAQYEAISGKDDFEVALQSLRVATQFLLRNSRVQTRDEFMAENTEWISRRIGPEGRMVLWAHNGHIANDPVYTGSGSQGFHLRKTFGDDLVTVAFSHESGRFTANHRRGDEYLGLDQSNLTPVRRGSWEHFFSTATAPRFVLDLRTSGPGPEWLYNTRSLRSIGAIYDLDYPSEYWRDIRLAGFFDVIIHFESTRATTVLPFLYPDSW